MRGICQRGGGGGVVGLTPQGRWAGRVECFVAALPQVAAGHPRMQPHLIQLQTCDCVVCASGPRAGMSHLLSHRPTDRT
jgi:hypothetical protein